VTAGGHPVLDREWQLVEARRRAGPLPPGLVGGDALLVTHGGCFPPARWPEVALVRGRALAGLVELTSLPLGVQAVLVAYRIDLVPTDRDPGGAVYCSTVWRATPAGWWRWSTSRHPHEDRPGLELNARNGSTMSGSRKPRDSAHPDV
jgi:hypothetical protein